MLLNQISVVKKCFSRHLFVREVTFCVVIKADHI